MSNEPDPYEILQIRSDAGEDVIRAAYRALARRYHPDATVAGASSPQMVIVNWAWEILGNPDRRAGYDREHGITPHPQSTAQDVHPPATWSAPSDASRAGAPS
ncbi:MAG: DnaJ domain-containing protein, partial [Chloroflexi bacterium]|nr:DnaJ domain-containing protein [Chloroflexota bacterium]